MDKTVWGTWYSFFRQIQALLGGQIDQKAVQTIFKGNKIVLAFITEDSELRKLIVTTNLCIPLHSLWS